MASTTEDSQPGLQLKPNEENITAAAAVEKTLRPLKSSANQYIALTASGTKPSRVETEEVYLN